MTRGQVWAIAFAVVAAFVVAGALFDDKDQHTWAVVSTLGVIGVVVLVAVYFAINGLQRLLTKLHRLRPRAFRRR
jgi:peptidoglycan/LPS O-acetylase OafA/YrhL